MQVPGKCTEEEFWCLCRSWQETWQRRVWPQLQRLHTIRWGEEKRRAFGRRGAWWFYGFSVSLSLVVIHLEAEEAHSTAAAVAAVGVAAATEVAVRRLSQDAGIHRMVLQEVIGTYSIFMILSLWNYWKVEDTTLEVPWDQRVLPNTLKLLGKETVKSTTVSKLETASLMLWKWGLRTQRRKQMLPVSWIPWKRCSFCWLGWLKAEGHLIILGSS